MLTTSARKPVLSALLAVSVIAFPAPRAQANEGVALIGGLLLGGIVAHEITKNNYRNRVAAEQATQQAVQPRVTRTQPQQSFTAPAPQRLESRQVQTALTYFGYDVGAVDGVIGRKSRAGISAYQVDLGMTPDGRLNDGERAFLLGAYQRAEAASTVPPYNRIVASEGRKGLLKAFYRESLGQPMVVQAAVTRRASPDAGRQTADLPRFGLQSETSMAASCARTAAVTATNGGTILPGTITDAPLALAEQFCAARASAITDTQALEGAIAGFSPAQVSSECGAIAGIMAPYVAQLDLESPRRILADIDQAMQGQGQDADELRVAGRICLGIGYRDDDADMALGSALLVAAMGEPGYGEIISHHLRQGLGVEQAGSVAYEPWMQVALEAEVPALALGQDDLRLDVLREATQG